MDRTDRGLERNALHGTLIDYLYPLLGHDRILDAKTLQEYAPCSGRKARDDIRTLTRHGYLEPVVDDTVTVLESGGMERLARRTGEPVVTDTATYTLGREGVRYVEERDLMAMEESLAYIFGD